MRLQERSPMNDAAKRKEREMVQKEIDKLRLSIQTLTRSANPLGKIMDFIQEDLDQMQKELEMWKKEHKENSLQLQREQRYGTAEGVGSWAGVVGGSFANFPWCIICQVFQS